MSNINEELASAVFSKYYHIGLQLKIDESKLDEFELTHQRMDRRFSAVISYWRKGNAAAVTWESLLAALKRRSVGEKGLADKLADETAISVASYFNIDPANGIIRDGSILPSNLRITVSSESDKYEVCDLHGVMPVSSHDMYNRVP